MRHFVSIASVLTVALLVGGQSVAQQPPPNPPAGGTPDEMPFDIPYGMPLTAILNAAEAEAKKRNWKMNIAVVDPNGDLIHFLRMDGAQVASVTISQGKARTAARYRRPRRCSTMLTKPVTPTSQPSTPHSLPLRAASHWSRAAS